MLKNAGDGPKKVQLEWTAGIEPHFKPNLNRTQQTVQSSWDQRPQVLGRGDGLLIEALRPVLVNESRRAETPRLYENGVLSKFSYPIVVHSHLPWTGVWQRPQQFLSRLSSRHRVLFVEGPYLVDSDIDPQVRLLETPGYPNVTVVQMEFPTSRFSDGSWVDQKRCELLLEALEGPLRGQFVQPVQWFYDPMAAPCFVGRLQERTVVYDCMDELSQFRFAPAEIVERERFLLSKASVVFTGGRKLLQAKSKLHSNCHFYGCGVDVEHFAKAQLKETATPGDIRSLSGPIFGYFGVVDERLDYDLIAALARANPEGNVVIVGPLAKVNAADLPRAANLHWLGRREYSELPAYVKRFDVCLMPFALNEATEFINPTKTLEYMAAGKPIVSTPVPDVVSNFGEIVAIASDHACFIELCRQRSLRVSRQLIALGLRMAAENRWEQIVENLEGHIAEVLEEAARAEASGLRARLAAYQNS